MKKMNKRSEAEIKSDAPLIAELFLRGDTHQEITDKLCLKRKVEGYVTRTTVTRDLQKIVKDWQEQKIDFIEDKMLIELTKIDKLESKLWTMYDEMMEAWQKSKEFTLTEERQIGKKISKLDMNGNPISTDTPDSMEQQNTITRTPGEVSYMREARAIMDLISKQCERRTKLLGLDKIKIELEGNLNVQQIIGMKIL